METPIVTRAFRGDIVREETNIIYNEDCFITMDNLPDGICDVILTSPFYNTNEKAGKGTTILNTKAKNPLDGNIRYDVFVDTMSNEEYIDFTVNLFNKFDRVLKKNGVVLYNISYGSKGCDALTDVIYNVIHSSNFSLADTIIWKKKSAFPNSCSPNKLTRIWEYVYVFCRKDEFMSFGTNKRVTSLRKTSQKAYENVFNFVEADNNDGTCPFNKATYSTDLCKQLLDIYAPDDSVVYDPFMGSGTTAVACIETGRKYIGSEISPNQVKFARDRISGCGRVFKDEQVSLFGM